MRKRSFLPKLLVAGTAPLFILMLFFSSSMAGTTGKIAGKIIDATTKSPMPGVNVTLGGTTMGAATDMQGEYHILNLPPGIYSVKASILGYKTVTKTKVNVSIDHTTRVDFLLEESVLEVGEAVTVTAERPLVERDETSTRHFVEAEEISSRPTSQLMEILTTLPGIDRNPGGELQVRRGSLDQVAFIIDGVRARNPLDFEPYTNINLSAIQELEIITGGFNAEYGEAQSGVFNIVTKEGSNTIKGYSEFRWTPADKHHWGTALYDYSSARYWENSHARHLQWWIDNPDQWVDPNGILGNDPRSLWTPEQAYADYMQTHQPLTDYTERQSYQGEMSLGGPLPVKDLFFFASGRYRASAPITGNSFRDLGTWFDGTVKLSYNINPSMKLVASGFFNNSNSNAGMEFINGSWVSHGVENKYAYFDFDGYPENRVNGQTLKFTHVLNSNSLYELQLSRVYRYRSQSTFPNDPDGWELGVPEYDRLRAVDAQGNPITGGFSNLIGMHTTGYYYRGRDRNTDWTFSGDLVSQLTKRWQIKGGFDFTYYRLDRFQEAKAFNAVEQRVYHPYEGAIYVQSKLEFEGLIMNPGLRYDFYNVNDEVYLDLFDPLDLAGAARENRTPNPKTKPTSTHGQLSPRIGISHPISDKTVMHFSYGHFFQRPNFGDYGEGTGDDVPGLSVSGILNTYLTNPTFGYRAPYNLGNRELKPRKTVAYELGIERNFGGLIVDVTAFYKDYTNTVRSVRVFTVDGSRYVTTGNADYADAKGVEVSVRRPLFGYWGGYLNYSWSTGIQGVSGDPKVLAPPGSNVGSSQNPNIGDQVQYDPARLKFGVTIATPDKFSPLFGLLSNMQISLDYQVYYPHSNIPSDTFTEGTYQLVRPADKNADIRVRKELSWKGLRPALFVEIRNAFNDKWVNLDLVESSQPEDRVRFINSNLSVFPQTLANGGPFPDLIQYRNLPRQISLGMALSF